MDWDLWFFHDVYPLALAHWLSTGSAIFDYGIWWHILSAKFRAACRTAGPSIFQIKSENSIGH